jgi:hypothetical protein
MVGSMRFRLSCKKENPGVVTTHCFFQRVMLMSKTLGDEVKKFWMMLPKWLTLLNKDQFTQECLKTV